ncbi:MAG: hypothetical protein H6553_00455 [Chitinophagales bacterium]|nr:hypothetical protein [Chitinophagales bacterium]
MNLFLSYKHLFPEEKAFSIEEIKEKLSIVNKDTLFKIAIVLISREIDESAKNIILNFFNNNLSLLKDELIKKVENLNKIENTEYFLLNLETSFQLFEIIYSVEQHKPIIDLTDSQIEVLLFKVYLSISEYLTELQVKNNEQYKNDTLKILFTLSFAQNDFYNIDKIDSFIAQVYKAKLLFDFLEEYDCNLLEEFLKDFGLVDKYSYIKHTVSLCMLVLKEKKKEHKILKIENTLEKLINRMTVNLVEKESDIDFRLIRDRPLYKDPEKENDYWLIYDLFLIDKIYTSIYFMLQGIYLKTNITENKRSKIEDRYRTFFTTDISEKRILYTVLNYIFGDKNFYKKSGKEIEECYNFKGGSDFYIRKNNTIYLFESKDILIKGDVKRSYNYDIILEKIKDAFIEKKGIPQLLKNIEKIIKNEIPYDSFKNTNKLKIYPIIITHNRQLDVVGLNNILNIYFEKELLKYDNINNIKPITLINIDAFIVYQDYLKNYKHFDFEILLNKYNKQINKKIKKEDTIDLNDYIQKYTNNTEPFSLFISKKTEKKLGKRKYPKILNNILKDVFYLLNS